MHFLILNNHSDPNSLFIPEFSFIVRITTLIVKIGEVSLITNTNASTDGLIR